MCEYIDKHPQGFLANLQVSPTLEDQIRQAQLLDAMVKKVKIGIAKSQPKYKCYRLDDKDTLFFEDRIVVPKGDISTHRVCLRLRLG